MIPWFEDNPARYHAELDELRRAGLGFKENDELRAKGHLQLEVYYVHDGGTSYPLVADFHSGYPLLPFAITAPENFPPGRHMNPQTRLLCMIEDLGKNWDGARTCLADIIQHTLPVILKSHAGNELPDQEANEAFRGSNYIPYGSQGHVFVGDWPVAQSGDHGVMTLAINPNDRNKEQEFYAALVSLKDQKGGVLDLDPGNILTDKGQGLTREILGKWIALSSMPYLPVVHDDAGNGGVSATEFLNSLNKLNQGILSPIPGTEKDKTPQVIGVCFPEEKEYGTNEVFRSWIFLVGRSAKKGGGITFTLSSIVRPAYLERKILQSRAPRTSPLKNKVIVIAGIGALGASIALAMAKAGVKSIRLIDHDILESGNLSRWAPALHKIGKAKVRALSEIIEENYPYVGTDDVTPNLSSTGI